MEWTNWQVNIEQLLNHFFVFSKYLYLDKNLKRQDLKELCEKDYSGQKETIFSYSETWFNTSLPALLKLSLIGEQKYLYLSDIGEELFLGKVSFKKIIKRQILEYQYYNPFTSSGRGKVEKNSIFPYWLILKFLYCLSYINEIEAKYIILKIGDYSEDNFDENKSLIINSRKTKNQEEFFLEKAITKTEKVKAWQYERNILEWTGLCLSSKDKKLEIIESKKEEVKKIVSKVPLYEEFDKNTWVLKKGRKFNQNFELTNFNHLIFGSPGTGKSYLLEEKRKLYFDDNHFERVTFYDGYTYGQFVGSYKPKVKEVEGKKDIITYEYVPGPFMKMLVKALKKENRNQKFLVLIEELNRAKADSVFGDIFQLLDRNNDGESKYRIAISEDQEAYLKEQGLELEKLYIPNNLYIWATMNSADQGVYPLDTAFKRRWTYKYLTLNENEEYFGSLNGKKEEKYKNYKINIGNDEGVEWNKLRRKINEIVSEGNASEDRMLAPFFLVPEDFKKIKDEEETFKLNDEVHKFKLLSYLFDDLLIYDKKSKGQIFNSEIKTFSTLIEKYNKNLKDVYSEEFRKKFKDLETNGEQ